MKRYKNSIIRYQPDNLCLNDFSIYFKSSFYHLIHLQGPLIYPFDATKLETTYGHATSPDLILWTKKSNLFRINEYPNFDDSSIWTMHVFRPDTLSNGDFEIPQTVSSENKKLFNNFWMFYTGLNQTNYFEQNIGLAISNGRTINDWNRWKTNPVVIADSQYYQVEGDMAWRDPFVVYNDEENKWVMFIAAKINNGDKNKRGCIGLATSADLFNWEIQPPVLSPRKFNEMECPVVYKINNFYYMFVSISDDSRIYVYNSKSLTKDFKFVNILTDPYNYAPRLIKDNDGNLLFLHTVKQRWEMKDSGEIMRGKIAQPKVLEFKDGNTPVLKWYNSIENYLSKKSTYQGKNGVLYVKLDQNYLKLLHKLSTLTMDMRCLLKNQALEGMRLEIENNSIKLIYISDGIKLEEKAVNIEEFGIKFLEIKVLLFDEYLEVYYNDILIFSTMAYRYHHTSGEFSIMLRDNPIKYDYYEFIY